jgi:hypothetical protein
MAENNVVRDRFLDVGEEPKQVLMPIEGYENKPLVSLEEAVEPIEKTLYNLDTKVKTAKWNSRQPPDNLSSDESAAIHLYTMEWPDPYPSLYTLLNQQLRSKKRKNLTPWFLYLKLFLTALYKLPSFKGTIWRGINEDLSDQYIDECIWWGVSSCTRKLNVTEEFVSRAGKRTLFNIECINGKVIKGHSYNPEENEIVLMPGTYLRVVGKSSPADGLHIIHLQEEAPPYQTITPPFDLSSTLTNLTISTNKKSTQPSSYAASTLPQGEIFLIFSVFQGKICYNRIILMIN